MAEGLAEATPNLRNICRFLRSANDGEWPHHVVIFVLDDVATVNIDVGGRHAGRRIDMIASVNFHTRHDSAGARATFEKRSPRYRHNYLPPIVQMTCRHPRPLTRSSVTKKRNSMATHFYGKWRVDFSHTDWKVSCAFREPCQIELATFA